MVEWHVYLIAWIVAGVFAILAVLVSLFLIYKHLRNYTQPLLQRYIARIILMVPIYSIDSWLSLRFREYAQFLDVIRDCYEAYVLYMFFDLLISFINTYEFEKEYGETTSPQSPDDAAATDAENPQAPRVRKLRETKQRFESRVVEVLEAKPLMGHPFPFCCLPKYKPGRSFLLLCRRMVMQFVVIKPVTAIITCVLEVFNVYQDGIFSLSSGYMWVTIVDNISITVSMYYLVLFYHVAKDELAPFKPVLKFLCIKSIIMFAFWQGVAIAILAHFGILVHDYGAWTSKNVETGVQDFVICIEMFFLAIVMHFAFGYQTYRDEHNTAFLKDLPNTVKPLAKNFADVIWATDVLEEGFDVFVPTPVKKIGHDTLALGNDLTVGIREGMETVLFAKKQKPDVTEESPLLEDNKDAAPPYRTQETDEANQKD